MTTDEILAETARVQSAARAAARDDAEGTGLPAGGDAAGATRGRGALPPPVFLDARAHDHDPGPAGEIPLRVLEAPEPRGVYLHLHGGGWTIGAADLQDTMLWQLAQATGLTAISVDYRLAPEHPYPRGLTTARRPHSGCSSTTTGG